MLDTPAAPAGPRPRHHVFVLVVVALVAAVHRPIVVVDRLSVSNN